MAEELGIPVGQILNWMNTVEVRFQAIEENMPEQIQNAMSKAIENAQTKQREAYAKAMQEGKDPQGQGGGQGLGQLMRFLPMLMGGGGQDSEMAALTKEMMKVNIESIKTDIGFSKAIKNALVSKITGEAISKAMT